MKRPDFDVQIQPVGKNQPEIVNGASKDGKFEMINDHGDGIRIKANNLEAMFDRYSENYITALDLKHKCYEYREENYYPDRNGKWVRLEKKPGFFARIFGRRSK